ncbi:hypothetical protein [Frondihabitans australicus]|uniref:DUF1453 family protein n=1 Tax=Frondihabitans australicus TaxID=386892 RepID=A0A495IHT3_9MICO|nr:hypothetical protein [Frondihabitans australicus]RKR75543.1 hypothetical protein C8E83_2691 [Frondihabitans australicus]
MSIQLLSNIVIGIALVGFLAFRQMRWSYVDRSSLWRMPIILAVIGVVSIANMSKGLTITGVDIAFIGVELLISVGLGLVMGRITVFRRATQADSKGRLIQARTGGLGAALWLVLIAVRVGLDVAGGFMGAHLVTATGVILLTVAVNRAARALVLDAKIPAAPVMSRV